MKARLWLIPLLCTATGMVVVGWGLPGIAIVGTRPGPRIAALIPQVEVTVLFALGMFVWSDFFPFERAEALRRALITTVSGPRVAVSGSARRHLTRCCELLVGGALLWLLATSLPGGPTLRHVVTSRALLLAFAVFGVGLGACTSAIWRGTARARAHTIAIVLVMASTPLSVAPLIATYGGRPAIVQTAMFLNPWIVMAGVTGLDLLRMEWLYAFSPLGSVEAYYATPVPAIVVYAGLGLSMLGIAWLQFRRVGHRRMPGSWS